MTQAKPWQRFGIVFAIASAFIVSFHLFVELEHDLAARIPHTVCLPSQSLPTCYDAANNLSTQKTIALAVSPDGQILASATDQTIQLWHLSPGDRPFGKPWRSLNGHSDWLTALAISPDGQTLASSSLDATIKLWNLATGQVQQTFESGRVTCLQFSPDGQTLTAGSRYGRWADGQASLSGVQRWEVATGQPLATIGADPVAAIAFSKNGQRLASGFFSTRLWDLKTGQALHTLDSGEVTSLTFSPDGQTLITASSKTKFWSVTSGVLLQTLKSSASELALSPDGQFLAASSGGTINLWQLATPKFLGALRGSLYSSLFVAFGSKGSLISGSSDGIKIWRQTASRSSKA